MPLLIGNTEESIRTGRRTADVVDEDVEVTTGLPDKLRRAGVVCQVDLRYPHRAGPR